VKFIKITDKPIKTQSKPSSKPQRKNTEQNYIENHGANHEKTQKSAEKKHGAIANFVLNRIYEDKNQCSFE